MRRVLAARVEDRNQGAYNTLRLSLSAGIHLSGVVMKGTSTYVEKWSNISAYELNCVDFSFDGKLVAYGGADGLTIASADSGHLDAVVKHQHVPVTALAWLQSGSVVCAFSDGIIVQIRPLEVCLLYPLLLYFR